MMYTACSAFNELQVTEGRPRGDQGVDGRPPGRRAFGEAAPATPWSQTLRLQDWEGINLCCLSRWGWGSLWAQPEPPGGMRSRALPGCSEVRATLGLF